MNVFCRNAFLLLTLIFTVNAWADDIDLNTIVVTPSRTEEDSSGIPRNVDIITSKTIERSQAKDISSLLSELTSVNISDYGAAGTTKGIRMRGATASQVLVMVDGRPLNNPRDGQAELANIPVNAIDRIEVVHGPGSSIYGSNAMGGTVNIITKDPPRNGQSTELFSSFGTYRTYDERVSHGARIGQFGYMVNGEFQRTSGNRDNSRFQAEDLNTKLEYDVNDSNSLVFGAGNYRSKQGTPGSTSSFDIDDRQNDTKNFLSGSWKWALDESAALTTNVYQNYERLAFLENSAGSAFDTAGAKNAHTTRSRGLNAQFDKKVTDFYQAVTGCDFVANFNDSSSSGKHRYNVRAGYLENKFSFLENKLNINAGGRFDDYSNFGTEFNWSAGAAYLPTDRIRLHGLVSRSFRAPTFNDLYWPDEGWAKGNPSVKPETGITKEIGINAGITDNLNSGITFYRNDFEDLINWTEENWVWMPKNIGSAVIQGIEFENRLTLNENWKLTAGYTFMRAKDALTHRDLIYQPRHKADLGLKYSDRSGFTAEFKTQFLGKRFYDEANTITMKPYVLCGIDVSKRFDSGITCFLSADNMFDEQYELMRNYPMPGFDITGGVKLEF